MFTKSLAAGLAGSALLATVAFAQTPATTSDRSNMAAASDSASFQGNWRTSKVVGLSVYNDSNESVGSINDLLTDKSGNIKAAVISVGGVLGVGARLVAVPFDKVKFVNEPVVFTTATGTSNTGAGGTPSTTTAPSATTTTGSAGPGTAAASKSDPWYPDHAVYNASKDEMKAMPEFKYSAE
jgi:sporulation protein YlmC with PRC-barrel domain